MTTNHHTAISTGAAANASTFNNPLGQLDAQITTNAAAIAANALLAAATTAEVVAARGSSPDLDARLDALVLAGGNVATKANGVSAAGQKVLTVDSTTGFIVGAYVTYLLNGTTLEGNTIGSIQAGVSLTLGTNIGTGGVLDDSCISMISISEYLAAQAIPHAGTLMLPDTIEIIGGSVYNVLAYGASTAASAAVNVAAFAAAIAATPVDGVLEFPPGEFAISGNPAISFNKKMGIVFNGTRFLYDGHDVALHFGHDSSRIFDSWVKGQAEVRRVEAISTNGTQTAASQLLGTGIEFAFAQNYNVQASLFAYGFKYGFHFGNNASVIQLHSAKAHNNLIDFYFDPGTAAGAFVTAIELYSPFNVFDYSFWSDVVGSRGIEFVKNGRTNDGHNVFGGVLEGRKERKAKLDTNFVSFFNTYWDVSNGGTDIELVAASDQNMIIGGGLTPLTIVDAGTNNVIWKPKLFSIDTEGIPHLRRAEMDAAIWTYEHAAFVNDAYYAPPAAVSGEIRITFTKAPAAIGDATTQWDISNPGGTTFRYTWDGTGTDPGLAVESHCGTFVVSGGTLAAGNKGTFNILTGTNFFEVTNAAGVVETNKVGTVMHHIAEHGTWIITDGTMVTKVSGTANTSDVFADNKTLSVGYLAPNLRFTNRLHATGKILVQYTYS